MKDLTSEKQGRFSTILDRSWKCITGEQEILSRWTENCSELYNYEGRGVNAFLDCRQPQKEDLQPIFREKVEIAVASLNQRKSAGVDNIPAELVQAGVWVGAGRIVDIDALADEQQELEALVESLYQPAQGIRWKRY